MAMGSRRLVAIMFTDMVGFTAMAQKDEARALALLEEQRKLVRRVLPNFGGSEVKTIGDAFLVEFESALDATKCAYEIQRAAKEHNEGVKADGMIRLRIGVHLGDVVSANGDISGDAVNVASRIEPLAEEGGVSVSRQVYDQVHNKVEFGFSSLGPKILKNVSDVVEVFKIEMPGERPVPMAVDHKRIAVLPFVNMSPDPNDSFFADGITEEIISTVSSMKGFSVISRTSVMGYKGTTKKMTEIGRELQVGSLLEGSLRKAGNRIRLTAQLIDANSDRHVWSQSYDRDLDDVFAVQTDIAMRVANALSVSILSEEKERLEKKPTESSAAHTQYLKGKYYLNRRGLEDLEKAAECFRIAVEEDPGFALGYAGLADSNELMAENWQVNVEENYRKSLVNVKKALEIDPDLAEAHSTMGLIYSRDYDYKNAEREFQRAIALNPSYATAHQWYSSLLMYQGKPQEAVREIELAVSLDPFSMIINLNNGLVHLNRRDYDRGLVLLKAAIELNPGDPFIHMAASWAYSRKRMKEESLREYDLSYKMLGKEFPATKVMRSVIEAAFEEDKSKLMALLPELQRVVGTPTGPSMLDMASFNMLAGNLDEGFAWLDRAFATKEPNLGLVMFFEEFDAVRQDPRYLALIERLHVHPPPPLGTATGTS